MLAHHHCSETVGKLPASPVVTYEMSYEITHLFRTHFYFLLRGAEPSEVLNCLYRLNNGQLVHC